MNNNCYLFDNKKADATYVTRQQTISAKLTATMPPGRKNKNETTVPVPFREGAFVISEAMSIRNHSTVKVTDPLNKRKQGSDQFFIFVRKCFIKSIPVANYKLFPFPILAQNSGYK